MSTRDEKSRREGGYGPAQPGMESGWMDPCSPEATPAQVHLPLEELEGSGAVPAAGTGEHVLTD